MPFFTVVLAKISDIMQNYYIKVYSVMSLFGIGDRVGSVTLRITYISAKSQYKSNQNTTDPLSFYPLPL